MSVGPSSYHSHHRIDRCIAQVAAQQALGLPTCGWPRTGAGHPAHSCVDGPVVATCLQDAFRFCMSFKASTYPRT